MSDLRVSHSATPIYGPLLDTNELIIVRRKQKIQSDMRTSRPSFLEISQLCADTLREKEWTISPYTKRGARTQIYRCMSKQCPRRRKIDESMEQGELS